MSTQNVTPSPSNHSSSLPPPQFSSSCHVIKLTTGGHECDFHRCCRKKSDIFKMKIVSPESCVSSTPNSTVHLQSNLDVFISSEVIRLKISRSKILCLSLSCLSHFSFRRPRDHKPQGRQMIGQNSNFLAIVKKFKKIKNKIGSMRTISYTNNNI